MLASSQETLAHRVKLRHAHHCQAPTSRKEAAWMARRNNESDFGSGCGSGSRSASRSFGTMAHAKQNSITTTDHIFQSTHPLQDQTQCSSTQSALGAALTPAVDQGGYRLAAVGSGPVCWTAYHTKTKRRQPCFQVTVNSLFPTFAVNSLTCQFHASLIGRDGSKPSKRQTPRKNLPTAAAGLRERRTHQNKDMWAENKNTTHLILPRELFE
jgi:hypothetical protein